MKKRSEPPKTPDALRDEMIGLGSRSLRKSYYGKLQQHLADLARFRELLDVATDAIVVAELPDYRLVDANRAGRALLGVADVPQGQLLSPFFSPPAWRRLERLVRRSTEANRGSEPLIVRVGGRGGRELDIAIREDSFGPNRYLVVVARDVTERRRAARALIAAKDEAERVARAKSDFLSIASHELRTPLTALQLRLEQAVRNGSLAAPLAEKVRRPLGRLAEIVDDLLEVSRLERGYRGLRRAPVDLRAVVANVVRGFRARVTDHRIVVAAGPPVVALADAARAAQVVANFLENAAKFSPPGSAIEIRVWSDARSAYVAVADHGPGIPEEERGKLFTPFSRLPGTRTIPGLGLGLYVSRQIARRHGGDILAGDTPGGGATLTLSIPRAGAQAAADEASGAVPAPSPASDIQ